VIRFYRALLRIYPASFRHEYGEEMIRAFSDQLREAEGAPARAARAAAAVPEVLGNALAVHAELLRQDLRYTLRMLARARAFALTAIAIIGFGVGANVAAFSLTDFILLRPLPFPESDRLVTVMERLPAYPAMVMSPANFRDWQPAATAFERLGVHTPISASLVGAGDPLRIEGTAISVDGLAALRVRPVLGRLFREGEDALDAPGVALLSDRLWRRVFGADPAIVGRKIVLDGVPREIVGVMAADFGFPSRRSDIWIPLSFPPGAFADRTNTYLTGIARLKPGVTLAAARAEMDLIAARSRQQYPKENENVAVAVDPLRDQAIQQSRVMVMALSGAALGVLLIVCANLANLLLARALGRRRELAVRTALGAGRERLVRQLATESLVLAAAGGALGIAFARVAVPVAWTLVPVSLPTLASPGIDLRVLAFAAVLIVVTALAFGLAPMVRGTAGAVGELRDGTRTTGAGRERLRAALVAVEVAASIVLLVVTGLLLRALWNVQHIDPGFRPEGVMTARTQLPWATYAATTPRFAFYDRVLGDIRALPGVQHAAYISGLPMVWRGGIWQVEIAGVPPGRYGEQTVSVRFVTPGFFDTMRIPLRGRDISDTDTMDTDGVAVVSESFARRYMPGSDAVGRRFNVALADRAVVGVAGDIHVRGLEGESEPQVYLAYRQVRDNWFPPYAPKDLAVRSSLPPEQLSAAIRRIVHAADPQQPVSDLRPMTAIVAGETATRELQARVLAAFAVVALALAAIGIHGVLAFAVSQRTAEIGVRLALGARRGDILAMMARQGGWPVVAGLVPGLAIAYGAGRWLESLLVGIRPTDATTFGAALLLALAMAAAGMLVPTLRALRIDPIVAIRSE
jgi:putative ABC transport system permease protein